MLPLPAPRCEIAIRVAMMEDLPFVDRLQKMHVKMVGFMPTGQLEEYVRAGAVLVADYEPRASASGPRAGASGEGVAGDEAGSRGFPQMPASPAPLPWGEMPAAPAPLPWGDAGCAGPTPLGGDAGCAGPTPLGGDAGCAGPTPLRSWLVGVHHLEGPVF
jgi:hypothetical protein